MAEPYRIFITNTPEEQYNLVEKIHQRMKAKQDAEWAAMGEEGESAARPTEEPAAPAQPEKPSAVMEGLKATGQAATHGASAVMEALGEIATLGTQPGAPSPIGTIEKLLKGLGQFGVSPFIGLGVGARQALKNADPDLEASMALEPQQAGFVRTMMGHPATPGQQPGPMSVGELLEVAAPMIAPRLPHLIKQNAPLVKEAMLSERGALGVPPRQRAVEPTAGESRINVQRVTASEGTKRTMQAISAAQAEKMTASRQTVSHAQTVAESRGLFSLEEAIGLEPGEIPLADVRSTQMAVRDHYNAAASYLNDVKTRVLKGDPAAAEDIVSAYAVAARLAGLDEFLGTRLAQGLEARKIQSESGRAPFSAAAVAQLAEALENAPDLDPTVLAARLDALTPAERRRLAGWTAKYANAQDVLHWAFINEILSNPVTHAANVLGTGAMTLYHIPERFMAEMVNQVFFRGPEAIPIGDTWAAMRGMVRGTSAGLRMMGQAITKGEDAFGPGRVEAHFDLKATALGLDPTSTLGRAVDAIGMLQPTRWMKGEDAFFKGIHKYAEINALALQEAKAEGLTGATLAERTSFLERNPTDTMIARSEDAALLRTLNAPLGPIGQKVMQIRNMVPGANYQFAFVQTPGNASKWFWQRTPVLNMLSEQNYRDLGIIGETATPRSKANAVARIALGNALAIPIVWYVTQGVITGGGSLNRNLRIEEKDVRPPYSILVGDTPYAYDRAFDPVGIYVGAIADTVELMSQVPDPEQHWTEIAAVLGLAGSRVVLNKTYMRGVKDILDAIERPDSGAHKLAQNWARSIVPALVRQAARTGIPGIIEAHPELKEVRTIADAIKSGIPDFSPLGLTIPGAGDVPPRIHPITGDPVVYPPGWGPDIVSPIYVTQRSDSLVLNEIVAQKMNIPVPGDFVAGQAEKELHLTPERPGVGVRMTPGQRYRRDILMTKAGAAPRIAGDLGDLEDLPPLHTKLEELMRSDEYKHLPPYPSDARELAVRRIQSKYRELAERQLFKEALDLKAAVYGRKEQRIRSRQMQETTAPVGIAPGSLAR